MTNDQIKECAKNEALYAINSLESVLSVAETIKESQDNARETVKECDNVEALLFMTKFFKNNAEALIANLQAAIRHIDQATANIEDLASRIN